MGKYNEKQKGWTRDYNARAYDEIKVRVPKGMKGEYKALAESLGMSLNQLIVSLLEEKEETT